MLIKKYGPRSEVQKMETELWNLKVKGEKTVDNKRKWEGNHNNNNNNYYYYNQNKRHEMARVYTVRPADKGKYARNLPHYKQQIRETKTTRGTYLPATVVDRKGIIGMNVQK
ncbi:hypothetical protein Tco_0981164 [Tanacetum coccineum]